MTVRPVTVCAGDRLFILTLLDLSFGCPLLPPCSELGVDIEDDPLGPGSGDSSPTEGSRPLESPFKCSSNVRLLERDVVEDA